MTVSACSCSQPSRDYKFQNSMLVSSQLPGTWAVVADGQWIPMSCRTDKNVSLSWRSKRNNACPEVMADGEYTISSGTYVVDECVNKSFLIDHRIEGQFDLLVKATLGNANAYTCQEPGRRDSSSSAELIVLSMRFISLSVFCMFVGEFLTIIFAHLFCFKPLTMRVRERDAKNERAANIDRGREEERERGRETCLYLSTD